LLPGALQALSFPRGLRSIVEERAHDRPRLGAFAAGTT
jgi:hypothetical protein